MDRYGLARRRPSRLLMPMGPSTPLLQLSFALEGQLARPEDFPGAMGPERAVVGGGHCHARPRPCTS
jgi:hypothetical protein